MEPENDSAAASSWKTKYKDQCAVGNCVQRSISIYYATGAT